MKKFSKVLEQIENSRHFKVDATIELIIETDNEGEAGYLADSILGGVAEMSNYQIVNIDRTEERISENNKRISREKWENEESEEILEMWEKEFGEVKSPNIKDKMEWYHKMRSEGFDGILIFKTLGDKF